MNNGCYGKKCVTCIHYYRACNDDFCYQIAPKDVLLERMKNPSLKNQKNEIMGFIILNYGYCIDEKEDE
jgi:hypothetical protein